MKHQKWTQQEHISSSLHHTIIHPYVFFFTYVEEQNVVIVYTYKCTCPTTLYLQTLRRKSRKAFLRSRLMTSYFTHAIPTLEHAHLLTLWYCWFWLHYTKKVVFEVVKINVLRASAPLPPGSHGYICILSPPHNNVTIYIHKRERTTRICVL